MRARSGIEVECRDVRELHCIRIVIAPKDPLDLHIMGRSNFAVRNPKTSQG
jgi:hypothetical protein